MHDLSPCLSYILHAALSHPVHILFGWPLMSYSILELTAEMIEFLPLTEFPKANLKSEEAIAQVIHTPKPDISLIVTLLPD